MKERLALMAAITMGVMLAGQGYAQDAPATATFGAGQSGGRRGNSPRMSAKQRPHRGGGMRNAMLFHVIQDPRMAEEIDLTDETVKALKDAFQTVKMKQIDLEAKRDKLHLQQTSTIAELMADKSKEGDEAIKILEEIGEINTELSKLTIDRILAIRENLTEEQLKAAREAVKNRRKEMRKAVQQRAGAKRHQGEAGRHHERRQRPHKTQD